MSVPFRNANPNDDYLLDPGEYGVNRKIKPSVIKKLRDARVLQGISQMELAAKTGVPQSYISFLENGKVKRPSINYLRRYAVGVNVELVLEFEEEGTQSVSDMEGLTDG